MVFLVIFFLTSSISKPRVSFSISANTGLAPAKITQFAVDINEKEGTITSPEVIPRASNTAWRAEVPELKQTT